MEEEREEGGEKNFVGGYKSIDFPINEDLLLCVQSTRQQPHLISGF